MQISALMLPLFSPALVVLLAAGISGFLLPLPSFLALPVLISTGLNRRNWKLLLPLLLLSLILICSLLSFSNSFLRQREVSFVLSRDSVLTAFPVPHAIACLITCPHWLLQAVCGQLSCRGYVYIINAYLLSYVFLRLFMSIHS